MGILKSIKYTGLALTLLFQMPDMSSGQVIIHFKEVTDPLLFQGQMGIKTLSTVIGKKIISYSLLSKNWHSY